MQIFKFIILVLILGSCSPKILSTEKTIRDSIIIREVEKQVLIPAYSGSSLKINIDSLKSLLASGLDPKIIERTLIREDPETKMKVGILIDSLGNLSALCEQQERMISVLVEEREILRSEFERVIVRERENIIIQAWNWFKILLIVIALILMTYLLFTFLK